MKKIIWLFVGIVVCAAIYFYTALYPRLQVVAGYSVKCGCTNHFYTERSLEDVKKYDLAHMPVPISFETTDTSVVATVLGIVSSTAVKKGDIGCVLLRDAYDGLKSYKDIDTTVPDSFYHTSIKENRQLDTTIDYKALDAAIANAFDPNGALTDKKTRAIVVLHNGKLVGEKYAQGHTKDTRMLGWSISKSITSSLIGLLVKDGKINVHDKNLFTEWADDPRREITIENLLRMESGLEWEEDYTKVSSATEMLFRTDDVFDIAMSSTLNSKPGDVFYYSSGTTNLLSGIIKSKFESNEAYFDYLQQRLFNKIGMRGAFMETDEKGTYIGSSYTYATPREWARYGQLYLQNGLWNGTQLFPEGWVAYTRTPGAASQGIYGAQWRLNNDHKEYKDAPTDLFSANGYQGQRIFVIPSLGLVIVRLGFNSDYGHNALLKGICQSIKK